MAAPFRLLPVVLFVGLVPVALPRPAFAADGPAGGVALIPEDAAFVSATLRLREQWERVVKSNAFASLKKLPFVQRALDQLEEQKLQPGSPLSMFATFMELPENQQALELLEDMVSTDTFLYGEPSCVQFVELLQRVERARQAANILQATQGGMDFDFDLDVEVLEGGGAAAQPGVRVQPVQLVRTAPDERTGRMILQTLADNVQLIVVPDLVWGFKTEKLPAAESQLKRIEVLVKLFTQANPDLAESLQRRKIAGGEVVTFTIDGETLPWDDMFRELTEGMDGDALEKVLERLRSLDLVIGLGVIGDRIVLSIGDSADHLDKLGSANGGQRLIATKPFAPLAGPAAKDRKITGVSYLSEPLVRALAWSEANVDEFAEMVVDAITAEAELPEDGVQEARKTVAAIAASYKKRLPVPGAWMSYSFMSDRGYEGFVWDWTRNRVLDGSKRLDLLEHTGGAPLGAIVFRARNDKEQFEDVVAWGGMVWKFFTKYGLAKADDEDRERVGLIEKHLGPVVDKFVGTLRTKVLPALADGQIGFVLDAKSRTKRLQNALPEASDPLPLLEPAIMLGLDDAKLFREGLSDLFSLSDDLVDAVREIDPDAVPADYRVKDPEKAKVEGGSVWTWPLEKSGLDEQVRPAIGVGEDVAVLSLVPKQASRLLAASKLETGSQLSKFEEPLVAAAALDMAGIIDAIQPWIVYLTRYGCVQQRDGEVDRDTVLTKEVEHAQATDALAQVSTVCEALKSLRAAVAEMATVGDASVTHWQNVIRDLPAK